MKLKVISDITLNPFIDELKTLTNSVDVDTEYCADLISAIAGKNKQAFDAYDFVFIHIDCFFRKFERSYTVDLLNLLNDFSANIKPLVIISNSIAAPFPAGAVSKNFGQSIQYVLDNQAQIDSLNSNKNLLFFDFFHTLFTIGLSNAYNYNLGHLYQMPYTKKLLKQFAFDFNQLLNLYLNPQKKVLILDCDNTLWKGVLGEDGIDGIECDLNSNGIIHYDLQRFLKERKAEGFLLCICSKNNEDDVREAFEQKVMPLKWEDFIIKKINWLDKHENISAIVMELNVGMDSVVFIDDSDFEINAVKTLLPELTTFLFTTNYNDFIGLTQRYEFKRTIISAEDKEKTNQYKEELLRKNEMNAADSFDTYIKNLQIKLDIKKNDVADFERLSQLTEKTNQFNFNKKYYSVQALKEFIADKNGTIYSLKVSDKYGDYGTTGMLLIENKSENVVLENYIMSCRILGRRIEDNFFDFLIRDIQNEQKRLTEIKFVSTAKNKPAEEFLNKIQHENNY